MSLPPYERDYGECSFPGCVNRAAYKKLMLCPAHYQRNRNGNIGELKERPVPQFGCKFPDCDRPHKAKGWCEAHWEQIKLGRSQTPLRPTDSPPINGGECLIENCDRIAYCRGLCHTHYILRGTPRWNKRIGIYSYSDDDVCVVNFCQRKPNAYGMCALHRKRMVKFNLEPEAYLELISTTVCDICGRNFPEGTGHIDHDHACCPGQPSCGQCIRGVLCQKCNMALGLLNDDINILKSAINYLGAED